MAYVSRWLKTNILRVLYPGVLYASKHLILDYLLHMSYLDIDNFIPVNITNFNGEQTRSNLCLRAPLLSSHLSVKVNILLSEMFILIVN